LSWRKTDLDYDVLKVTVKTVDCLDITSVSILTFANPDNSDTRALDDVSPIGSTDYPSVKSPTGYAW